MKKFNILIFAFLYSCSVRAQIPQIQWQKCLGGTDNENATSSAQTFDGGFVIASYSNSNDGDITGNHGGQDYWVAKLDATGNIQWQKSLGGTGNDYAYSVIQSIDSGYVVAGISGSNDGDVSGNNGSYDYWVVKLDTAGTIQWQQSLGGSDWELASSVFQTSDSGYIVAGWSDSNNGDVTGNHGLSDYWIVKLNASGNIQWQQSLGGTGYEDRSYVIQTIDSGYIVAGSSQSNDGDVTGNHGDNDYWVVKLNATGNIEWQESLGGTGEDDAFCITQTADTGYIIAGYSESNDGDVTGNHGGFDYWIVKLDAAGILQWQKSLGGMGWDQAYSIIQTIDNGYAVAGSSYSNDGDVTGNHGSRDYWVVKLNNAGVIEWQQAHGGTSDDIAGNVIATFDSSYVVTGCSLSNNGDVSGNHGVYDYWVVKLGMATGIENQFTSNSPHVYPNPSSNNFSIPSNSDFENAQLTIFNAVGYKVYSCMLNREIKVIDADIFSSGIYYLQIIKGENIWAEKIIKQ